MAVCVPLFLFFLGNPPLLDSDEPVYASTGRTLLVSHSLTGWWSPHYNGQLWFDKPPITYWLIALSMKLFGMTVFASRLPSALCAIVLVFVTIRLGHALFPASKWTAFCSGAVVATSLQTIILGRAATTDMILVLFLTIAVLGMWRWLANQDDWKALAVCGMSTGLAVLTKGPVAIVLVGGVTLFYVIGSRQPRLLLSPSLWGALVVSLLVALPWYLSMVHLHGQVFIQGFLESNNLTRYLKAEHPKYDSPLEFIPVLFAFIFPWSLALAPSLWRAGQQAVQGNRSMIFVSLWIAWVFLFFSLSETKLITYIYPLYPMAAVAIGNWFSEGVTRIWRIAFGLFYAAIAALLTIGLPIYIGNGLPEALQPLKAITGIFFASCAATLYFTLRKERGTAGNLALFMTPAVTMAVFFPIVACLPVWHLSLPDVSLRDLGRTIQALTPSDQTTYALTLKKPSLQYYADRHIIYTDNADKVAAALIKPPYPLCALKTTFLAPLGRALKGRQYKIVSQSGVKYVLIKCALN